MRSRTCAVMTAAARRERTARMIGARLDELAVALEREAVPAATAAQLLGSASIATDHAVELGLLTASGAAEVWRAAAERHPVLHS